MLIQGYPFFIHYGPILLAAVASMVLGGLWYSPLLFGKVWVRLMGWSHETMEKHKKGAGRGYLLSFIFSLVTAFLLSHITAVVADYFRYPTEQALWVAVQTGFWLWLGFVVPVALGSFLWEGKSFKLFLLNVSYHLVSLVAMAMILAKTL